MDGDDRTFGGNFSNEGIARLRERVKEKLKKFMGDYTDDTLVEYVIVLLKNGRRKDEAKSELNVFLADDSDSFISWLWDHLGSNLSLYVQPLGIHPDRAPTRKSETEKHTERDELLHPVSETEKENSNNKTSGIRSIQDRKGLLDEGDDSVVPISRKSLADHVHSKEEPHQRVDRRKQSRSHRPTVQKKRRRTEDQDARKREISAATILAPKRLLQFAVRDAVGTYKISNSTAEPSLKRLRSVVSTSMDDVSLGKRTQKIRQVAGLHTDMSAAIKAVTAAVKDVSNFRTSQNVFDRLGYSPSPSNIKNLREEFANVSEYGDFVNGREDIHSTDHEQNYNSMLEEANMSSFDDDAAVTALDFGYVREGFDDADVEGRGDMDISQLGAPDRSWVENSKEFQYGIADKAERSVHRAQKKLDPAVATSKFFKIASSVNVNTWKPFRHQEAKPGVGPNPEPQKTLMPIGVYSTSSPTEDADSRTVFVSNVHFAATKDSLSQHFSKFGEVLKVVILTDLATGQPKGSAYIEFTRKGGAELSLSVDGTSFMSRILKIVRKSSVQSEDTSVTTWLNIAQASSFGIQRFGRVPNDRGISSLHRPRIPNKPGARNFQWKREPMTTDTSNQGSNSLQSSTKRSFTYVRTDPKTNGNSTTA